jgi:zinc transporter
VRVVKALQQPEVLQQEGRPDGQVWGLLCRPGAAAVEASPELVAARLAGQPLPPDTWLWLHLDAVSPAVHRRLQALDWLPEQAQEVLVQHQSGLQIDCAGEVVFGSLPGFDRMLTDADQEVLTWRFALLPDLLITTRRRPIPVLFSLARLLASPRGPDSPPELVDAALLAFGDDVRRMTSLLDDDLDRVEDGLLETEQTERFGDIGSVLGRTRRHATQFRRLIAPMDRIMQSELDLPPWLEESLLNQSRPQLRAVIDDLLALQDRARSLQDELASRQAEETNRRLYLVSIMTTLMLPATFVTGFFGMNTGGMFLANVPHGTALAGVICLLFMLLAWLLLKRLRLL